MIGSLAGMKMRVPPDFRDRGSGSSGSYQSGPLRAPEAGSWFVIVPRLYQHNRYEQMFSFFSALFAAIRSVLLLFLFVFLCTTYSTK